VFSFLHMLQYIRMTSMLYWKLWFANGAQHFSHWSWKRVLCF
jgi:hypothetical protein